MKIDLGSEWQIPSSSGREMISASLKSVHDDADDSVLIFDIKCRRTSFNLYSQGELVEVYDLSLHQVAVSQRKLSKNVSELTEWLNNPKQMELEFSTSLQHSLKFWFGVHSGVISSREKPVCKMYFETFLSKCDVGFVVDQSCIKIFRDSLADFSK